MPDKTKARHVGIATFFLFLLVAAAVLYYPSPYSKEPLHAQAMVVPSDSCIGCHTNPQIINSLGSARARQAGGC